MVGCLVQVQWFSCNALQLMMWYCNFMQCHLSRSEHFWSFVFHTALVDQGRSWLIDCSNTFIEASDLISLNSFAHSAFQCWGQCWHIEMFKNFQASNSTTLNRQCWHIELFKHFQALNCLVVSFVLQFSSVGSLFQTKLGPLIMISVWIITYIIYILLVTVSLYPILSYMTW